MVRRNACLPDRKLSKRFVLVLVQLIDRTSARVVGRAADVQTGFKEIPTLKPES